MGISKICSVVAVAFVIIFAAAPEISITGTVTDGSDPVEGAVVRLVDNTGISDTTDEDGVFDLSNETGIGTARNLKVSRGFEVGIDRTRLSFNLSEDVSSGVMALFNSNGRSVADIRMNNLTAGNHTVDMPTLSTGFYLVKLTMGGSAVIRKLIVTGSGSYLDGAHSADGGLRHTASLKKTSAEVDRITVEKEGYATKDTAIESFQIDDMKIVLAEEGNSTTTDVTKAGPYETVSEDVPGAILIRPKDLEEGRLYPVVTWGHGAMGSPGDYTNLITFMASHGFVVVGSKAENVQDGGDKSNQFRNDMVKVAEWVIEQNDNSSSELYQKIAIDKVGAAGHSQGGYGATECGQNPLITTSVSSCGAVGSDKLKGPALILCGGKDNNSGAQCSDHPEDAYNGINNVPVMKAEHHDADHGWSMDFMGSSDPNKPHEMAMAMTAWFRYHLMGDEEYKSWFYGDDCYLCGHDNWSVKRKMMD